jgi:cytochrome b6-f complex iron-sulfur subunit
MNSSAILVLAFVVIVALAAILLFGAMRRRETGAAVGGLSRETRRRDRGSLPPVEDERPSGREVERSAALERRTPSAEIVVAAESAPVPWVPPDPETLGVSRRQFLNRSIVNLMGFSLGVFGLASIAFLWPQAKGGFGSKIKVGKISDIQANIKASSGFAYYPAGRMWITEYPEAAIDKAKQVKAYQQLLPGMEAGVVALYQKCVHLGCRVPACLTSQWFECPCHGSKYNRVGEKKGGPAPRGLDHFLMIVDNNELTVDTGNIILGPPIGTNTTGQEAEGPHCVSVGGSHH